MKKILLSTTMLLACGSGFAQPSSPCTHYEWDKKDCGCHSHHHWHDTNPLVLYAEETPAHGLDQDAAWPGQRVDYSDILYR